MNKDALMIKFKFPAACIQNVYRMRLAVPSQDYFKNHCILLKFVLGTKLTISLLFYYFSFNFSLKTCIYSKFYFIKTVYS